jgi:dolichyldiphosphatase
MYGKGYGMPSSHSQFVAFFSLTFSLFLIFRHTPKPSPTHTPLTFTQRLIVSLLACVCAGAVAVSRVYLNYHTPKQVLAGAIVGVIVAVAWFAVTHILRQSGWLDWALDTQLARLARVRDLVLDEDLVEAGWHRYETRRRSQRKGDIDPSRKLN